MATTSSDFSKVYNGIEFHKEEPTTLEYAMQWVKSMPLWVGPLPEGTYSLYPMERVFVPRSITYIIDEKWQNITYGSWVHPEIEGVTRDQGTRCAVWKNKQLWVVKWKSHGCEEPSRPMTAEDWDHLLHLGDD